MKKNYLKLYIGIVLAILLILGSSIFWGDGTNVNEESVSSPEFVKNGKLNEKFLDDSEEYISKKYAFRNDFLELHTSLVTKVFHTSPVDNVILGENDFIYFKETLPDYMANREFTSREVFQTKKTLELMDEYVKSKNGEFMFLIAPNKKTLYDNMPYYCKKGKFQNKVLYKMANNLDNINYVDAYNLIKNQKEVLYYKTDTHWNNKGTYLVYEDIMNKLGTDVREYSKYKLQDEKIKGDLHNMLYPNREANEILEKALISKDYKYLTRTRSTEQSYIETTNPKANGSLLMFRDSFANNLIPYLSNDFKYAIYDKKTPYNFTNMDKYKSDVVILEIAERNIKLNGNEKVGFVQKIEVKGNSISGILNEKYLEDNSEIFIKSKGKVYELTPQMIDGKYGFYGYLENNIDQYELFLVNKNKVYCQ